MPVHDRIEKFLAEPLRVPPYTDAVGRNAERFRRSGYNLNFLNSLQPFGTAR